MYETNWILMLTTWTIAGFVLVCLFMWNPILKTFSRGNIDVYLLIFSWTFTVCGILLLDILFYLVNHSHI